MKILRVILIWLGLAAGLAALLVLTAVSPPLQTWAVQAALNRQPGVQASVDSLSAGFGRVDIEKARIEFNGAVLTLPLLQAQVPLTRAILERKASVQGLLAKGWTLDLSKAGPSPGGAAPEGAAARRAGLLLLGGLTAVTLPWGVSLDGVDLDGDVVLPGDPGAGPARVHLTLSGGRDGQFAFDASAEGTGTPVNSAFAHGTLTFVMHSARTVDGVKVAADVTLVGEAQANLAVSVLASAERRPGGAAYALTLTRGGRRVAAFEAARAQATGGLAGTWSADLAEADVAPFAPFASLPPLAAVGEGRFEADDALSTLHAVGRLRSAAGSLGFLAPALDRIGKASVDADFDATLTGRSLHVDHLKLSLEGTRSSVVLQALQAFDFDAATGGLVVGKPGQDLLQGSVKGLPLAWLTGPDARLRFTGGVADAAFVIRPQDGGFALRLTEPLAASGVALSGPSGPILGSLDIAAPLAATYSPAGWEAAVGPLTVRAAGRVLVETAAKASRPAGPDATVTVTGTWTADLGALAAQAGLPAAAGGSASGGYTAKVGDAVAIDGTVAWTGRDAGLAVSSTVHADVDPDGDFSFTAPVDFATKSGKRELSAEGSCAFGRSGGELDLKLASEDIAAADLGLLAGPLASMGGGGPAPGARGAAPFWGSWTGTIAFSFKLLRALGDTFDEVGGVLRLTREQVRLETGRTWILNHNLGKFEGTLAFDPAQAVPYLLKASGTVEDVDAAAFFGPAPKDQPAWVEGKFAATAALSGGGTGPESLFAGLREEVHLKSPNGIIRLLRTSVADAVPEASTPVTDAVGDVGSAVGSIFGIHKGIDRIDRNTVSPAVDAIINFTYDVAEIGFDRLEVTAVGGPGRAIHLSSIELDCPDERLRGSGDIAFQEGKPLSGRPLSLDLVLSLKGDPADLLSKAGLLAPGKDDAGFRAMTERFQFAGTLGQVDTGPWHDMLAKAVARNSPARKKDG